MRITGQRKGGTFLAKKRVTFISNDYFELQEGNTPKADNELRSTYIKFVP